MHSYLLYANVYRMQYIHCCELANSFGCHFGIPGCMHSDRDISCLSIGLPTFRLGNARAVSHTNAYNFRSNGEVDLLNDTIWTSVFSPRSKNLLKFDNCSSQCTASMLVRQPLQQPECLLLYNYRVTLLERFLPN